MSEQPTGVRAFARPQDQRPPWVRLVDGGTERGRAARRPPPSARRVLAQFVVFNLAAVVLLVTGSVYASVQAAADESLADARTTADLLATTIVEPAIAEGLLAEDREARAELHHAVESALRDTSLVRVKLWDSSGRIRWSDEPRLIDETFTLGDEEREALETGGTQSEISDLEGPENLYERSMGVVLLEVYRRVETPSGEPLLFETYLVYDDATSRQREIWLTFAPISITVLLLLLLVQLPLGERMVRKLREGEAERLGLQMRAADASIDERRRIAGTLHDGIVQDLAAASYVLSGATDQLAAGSLSKEKVAGITTSLRATEAAVRGSVTALRSLLIEIYPPHLAQAGLPAALRGLADRLQPRDGVLRIDVPDDVDVPEEQAALLFRVAQEALINVGRHAHARQVELRVRQGLDRVMLEVTDDGVGFDRAEGTATGHFGLRVLTDLAVAAGATLHLATAPGRGTALRLEVPLP